MGRNFDDYPGFQPFRSWANTQVCTGLQSKLGQYINAQFKKTRTLPFFANYPSMYILHATLHFVHKTWTTIILVGQEDRKRQQHGKNTVQKGIAFLSKYKYQEKAEVAIYV